MDVYYAMFKIFEQHISYHLWKDGYYTFALKVWIKTCSFIPNLLGLN